MNDYCASNQIKVHECSLFPGLTSISLQEEEDEEENNFSPDKNHPTFIRFREIDDEAKNQLYLLFSLQLQLSGLKKPFCNCMEEIEEQISYLTTLPREIKKLHETTLLMSANLLIDRIKDVSGSLIKMNKKLEDFLKSIYTSLPSISMFPPKLERIRKKYRDIEKEWIVPLSWIKKELSVKLTERSKWDIKSAVKPNDLSIILSCFDCLENVFQENLEQSIKQTTVIKEIGVELDKTEKEMNESMRTFLHSFDQLSFQINNLSIGTRFESYINPATVTNICFVIARTFGYSEVIKSCSETSGNVILTEVIDNEESVQTLSQEEKHLMRKFLVLVEEKTFPQGIPDNYISRKELLIVNPIMIDLMRLLPSLPKEIKGLWNIALQTLLIQFIDLIELSTIQTYENEELLKLVAKYKDKKEKIQELKKIIQLLPICPLNIQELIKTVLIYEQLQVLEKKTEIKITNSSTLDSGDKKNFYHIKTSKNVEQKNNLELMHEVESEEISQLQEELIKQRIILYHKNLRKLLPREITCWEQVVATGIRIPPEYLFSFIPEILNLYQSLALTLSETKRGKDHQLQTKVSELVTQIQEGEKKFAMLDADIQKDILHFHELDQSFLKNLALLTTLDQTFQTEFAALNKMAVNEKGAPEKSDYRNLHQTFMHKLSNIVANDSYETLHKIFMDDLEPKDKNINELDFKSDYQFSHSSFMKILQETLTSTYLKQIHQFQLKIANYDKSYQKISNELINPMINSNLSLEALLKDRIQLDQTMSIPKNCLDIITTHFDISLEALNSTFKTYQESTIKCKESKKTLSAEFKKMKQEVDNFKKSLNKFIYLTKYKPTDPTRVRSEATFLSWYPNSYNYLNNSLSIKSILEIQDAEQI